MVADEGVISDRVRVWVSKGGECLSVLCLSESLSECLGGVLGFLKACLKVF